MKDQDCHLDLASFFGLRFSSLHILRLGFFSSLSPTYPETFSAFIDFLIAHPTLLELECTLPPSLVLPPSSVAQIRKFRGTNNAAGSLDKQKLECLNINWSSYLHRYVLRQQLRHISYPNVTTLSISLSGVRQDTTARDLVAVLNGDLPKLLHLKVLFYSFSAYTTWVSSLVSPIHCQFLIFL
jgi:hypothetical protein